MVGDGVALAPPTHSAAPIRVSRTYRQPTYEPTSTFSFVPFGHGECGEAFSGAATLMRNSIPWSALVKQHIVLYKSLIYSLRIDIACKKKLCDIVRDFGFKFERNVVGKCLLIDSMSPGIRAEAAVGFGSAAI